MSKDDKLKKECEVKSYQNLSDYPDNIPVESPMEHQASNKKNLR